MENRLAIILVAVMLAAGMAFLVLPDSAPAEQDTGGQRIISFSPAVTETLFELGAGGLVVGADNWSLQRPQVLDAGAHSRIVNLGSTFTGVNPEQVLRLRPTLILAERTSASGNLDPIKGVKAEYAEIPLSSLRDLLDGFVRIGELAGKRDEATQMVQRIEGLLVPVTGFRKPRVLMLNMYFQDAEPTAVAGSSYQSHIIERVGGINVFADADRPTVTVSPERVSDLNPDIVILIGPPPDRLPRSHYLRRFQGIPAVHREMVFGIEGREALEKGPAGVEKLVESLKAVLLQWQARSESGEPVNGG